MTERQKLLLESPHLQEEHYPKLSSKSSSGSYVLQITSFTSHYAASASSPSNVIDVFDKSSLRGIQTLSGHEKGTTSLHTAQGISGVIRESLVSSGKDGSVIVWDVRSNAHSIKSMY
jgi:WD40 repeat protein